MKNFYSFFINVLLKNENHLTGAFLNSVLNIFILMNQILDFLLIKITRINYNFYLFESLLK
jgi:hypothetical protein